MGQVVKLCNNLIYAAQMLATAEATVMAEHAGVDLAQLYEVVTHATGDCVAVRTRLPAEGVVPDSPASNGWAPGFMTDLMAKDLDLAIGYAARPAHAALHLGRGPPAPRRRQPGGIRPRGLLRHRQGRPAAGRVPSDASLTLDLGTSATKAALWGGDELVGLARAPIATVHPQPGRAEQDPDEWWTSVVVACRELRARRAVRLRHGRRDRLLRGTRDVRPRSTTTCDRSGQGDPLVGRARPAPRVLHFGDPDAFRAENRSGAQRGVQSRGEAGVGRATRARRLRPGALGARSHATSSSRA